MALRANALATIAQLQTHVSGISDADATLAIDAASSLIERLCNRTFQRATVTERVAGFGRQKLSLSRRPVESVTSITRNGSVLDSTTYRIEDAETGLIQNDSGWPNTGVMLDIARPMVLPGSELRDHIVVYVGGYYLPNDAVPDAGTYPLAQPLPSVLVEACLAVATSVYRARGEDHSIESETVGNASVSYAKGSRKLVSDFVEQMLSDFKALA